LALLLLSPVATTPGDLNGDGTVDCADLAIIKASFGTRKGQAGFDARADTTNDGVVGVQDFVQDFAFVAQQLHAGTHCP
jgi:hypothetical protein